MRILFDLESNGLLREVHTIWCICCMDIDTGDLTDFGPNEIFEGVDFLSSADTVVGHNIIGYDLPVIRKLYPWFREQEVIDTLTISRLLFPDRLGGHSLAQWGEKVGVPKPVHEDWSKYSPEMLHRCQQDVQINYKVYNMLLEEMNED